MMGPPVPFPGGAMPLMLGPVPRMGWGPPVPMPLPPGSLALMAPPQPLQSPPQLPPPQLPHYSPGSPHFSPGALSPGTSRSPSQARAGTGGQRLAAQMQQRQQAQQQAQQQQQVQVPRVQADVAPASPQTAAAEAAAEAAKAVTRLKAGPGTIIRLQAAAEALRKWVGALFPSLHTPLPLWLLWQLLAAVQAAGAAAARHKARLELPVAAAEAALRKLQQLGSAELAARCGELFGVLRADFLAGRPVGEWVWQVRPPGPRLGCGDGFGDAECSERAVVGGWGEGLADELLASLIRPWVLPIVGPPPCLHELPQVKCTHGKLTVPLGPEVSSAAVEAAALHLAASRDALAPCLPADVGSNGSCALPPAPPPPPASVVAAAPAALRPFATDSPQLRSLVAAALARWEATSSLAHAPPAVLPGGVGSGISRTVAVAAPAGSPAALAEDWPPLGAAATQHVQHGPTNGSSANSGPTQAQQQQQQTQYAQQQAAQGLGLEVGPSIDFRVQQVAPASGQALQELATAVAAQWAPAAGNSLASAGSAGLCPSLLDLLHLLPHTAEEQPSSRGGAGARGATAPPDAAAAAVAAVAGPAGGGKATAPLLRFRTLVVSNRSSEEVWLLGGVAAPQLPHTLALVDDSRLFLADGGRVASAFCGEEPPCSGPGLPCSQPCCRAMPSASAALHSAGHVLVA